MTTKTCFSNWYAKYSAVVRAKRGVMIRSILPSVIPSEMDSRRIRRKVDEQCTVGDTSTLLKVLLEEPSSLHVGTHSCEHDRKVVLVSIVYAFGGSRTFDETSLTTNLGCNLYRGLDVGRITSGNELRLTSLCGRPAALKMGIFWPRAIEFWKSLSSQSQCARLAHHRINGGDTSLNHFFRVDTGVRVDGGP